MVAAATGTPSLLVPVLPVNPLPGQVLARAEGSMQQEDAQSGHSKNAQVLEV